VAEQPGAREVIRLEGINDIGYSQNHAALTAPHANVSALAIVDYDRIVTRRHKLRALVAEAGATDTRRTQGLRVGFVLARLRLRVERLVQAAQHVPVLQH
jgi:hypothetical protein